MFPWQFQKHPVPDELQMSARCALQWATLVSLDRSTPPLPPPPPPPFGAKTKSVRLRPEGGVVQKWSIKSPYTVVGAKHFSLILFPRSLRPSRWVMMFRVFRVSQFSWVTRRAFPLDCKKNAVDHILHMAPEAFWQNLFLSSCFIKAQSVTISRNTFTLPNEMCFLFSDVHLRQVTSTNPAFTENVEHLYFCRIVIQWPPVDQCSITFWCENSPTCQPMFLTVVLHVSTFR